jgi:hypothetical protein
MLVRMTTKHTAEKTETKYDWVDYSNGLHEVHACGCSHSKSFHGAPEKWERSFCATNLKDLCREIAMDFNKDFALDNEVTIEEYLDSGEGYEVSITAKQGVRIMPCVKFAN